MTGTVPTRAAGEHPTLRHAAVIGGGPAGLMAAEELARAGLSVTVHERMPSVGRKLLMAGRGGLNLTHSEPVERFVTRYGTAKDWIAPMLEVLSPAALTRWCEGLGQQTFVGSSGRVFPNTFKASPLLRAWLSRLEHLGVRIVTRETWQGWGTDGSLVFSGPDGPLTVRADVTVLALGGASWPRLGSDGGWVNVLRDAGVAVADLVPANVGVLIRWSDVLGGRFHGEPLKRIAITHQGRTVRGEAILTRGGLEGGAIYALGPQIRAALEQDQQAHLLLDLRPDLAETALAARLSGPRDGASLATILRKRAGLSPVAAGLVREAGPVPAEPEALARRIKAVPLMVTGLSAFDRAISSAGGVRQSAVDDRLMLKARPGVFVAGEMLDWEAPTGGYLLQASFASGLIAARGALDWLASQPDT
ncbi:MAG: TIGR03862 family flavoprotein [Beijerinckiaceae bacterium]|nr:TIGR03862 family flavoprotein [Beijerinckiaceae bacterium]